MKYKQQKWLVVTALVVTIGNQNVFAQEDPNFMVTLDVSSEQITYDYTLTFGFSPNCSDGFDPWVDIYVPPGFPGPLDAALIWMGDRFYTQIINGSVYDLVEHEWGVDVFFDGNVNEATISWDNTGWEDLGIFILQDSFDGLIYNIDMVHPELSTFNPDQSDMYTYDFSNPIQPIFTITNLALHYSLLKVIPFGFTLETDYSQNWNLISLPVQTDEYPCVTMDESTLYGFEEGGYMNIIIDEMEIGNGYWLRFNEEETCPFTGQQINESFISITEGWNLIGSISSSVNVNTIIDENNLIIPYTVYGFESGYFEAETIEPGYGYWLRSSGEGVITISSSAPLTKSRLFQPPEHLSPVTDANTLTFGNQTLYFGNEIELLSPLSFSLPPKPPVGAKDIRFSGNTKLCTSDDCLIEIMNDGSPLTFECEIKEGENWEIVEESENVFECLGVHEFEFSGESANLILRKSTSPQTPTEFALFPAHPNPFNPVTTIQFSIPDVETQPLHSADKHAVSLQIFDITGKLVGTLIDDTIDPGNHIVQWNAEGFSSGVYFLKLESGIYSQVEKLMLIK